MWFCQTRTKFQDPCSVAWCYAQLLWSIPIPCYFASTACVLTYAFMCPRHSLLDSIPLWPSLRWWVTWRCFQSWWSSSMWGQPVLPHRFEQGTYEPCQKVHNSVNLQQFTRSTLFLEFLGGFSKMVAKIEAAQRAQFGAHERTYAHTGAIWKSVLFGLWCPALSSTFLAQNVTFGIEHSVFMVETGEPQ